MRKSEYFFGAALPQNVSGTLRAAMWLSPCEGSEVCNVRYGVNYDTKLKFWSHGLESFRFIFILRVVEQSEMGVP